MGQKTHPTGFRVGIIQNWASQWYARWKDYKYSVAEDAKIRNFISLCEVINLSDSIREKTIQIRRTYRTKLPDSIIAGTAIICNVPLITADTGIFKVEELKVEKISL